MLACRLRSATSQVRHIRNFHSSKKMNKQLRIGFVPEHFCTPLNFAQKHCGLTAELVPFPSGTGHMVTAMQAGQIDIGVGLTEGWVAAMSKAREERRSCGYTLVGMLTQTPLCWAISTGAQRANMNSMDDLEGKKVGVSRLGSGSHVMSYVLAEQQGWLDAQSSEPPFAAQVKHTFANLREAVNKGDVDFFMWEHFTSKRYFDNGQIKRIGEIYTPWPAWMIVATNRLVHPADGSNEAAQPKPELEDVLMQISRGVEHFKGNQEEAIRYIYTKLDYSEEDARAWLKTVEWARDVRGVERSITEKTVRTLVKAGVLKEEHPRLDAIPPAEDAGKVD